MKIVFIGDAGVGKTSIIRKYLGMELSENSTLGVEVFKIPQKSNLIIWDLSGQPKFSSYIPQYLIGARVIVLVFDISNKASLESLQKWSNLLQQYVKNTSHVVVVGNKKDLGEQVSEEEVREALEKAGLPVKEFIKTSALTGENINLLFEKIIQLLTQ
ncbi:MAG: Rab family GTPase [Candidatus Njordarchaeales archaeon]